MSLTVEDALDALSDQHCPIDGASTYANIEPDEDGVYAMEVCAGPDRHVWPYARFTDERSTNFFEGEFDAETIAEKLEEYAV